MDLRMKIRRAILPFRRWLIERRTDYRVSRIYGGKPLTSWHSALLAKFPAFDPSWPDNVKAKWFETFEKLREILVNPRH